MNLEGERPATLRLSDLDTRSRFEAKVISSERITPDASREEVRELVLDVDLPELAVHPGQSLGVLAPGDGAFGKDEHLRLYTVADLIERGEGGKPRIRICVRRCFYLDGYSGERFDGLASNYLCDLAPGATINMTGPFGLPFEVPADRDGTLILIGMGTGIAPFRAFVRHLHENVKDWSGKIWLFHGATSGLELLYGNEERNDFAQYYDKESFEAFQALSPRPHWDEPIAWDYAILDRGEELWGLIEAPDTYVYVAGLEPIRTALDNVFTSLAGSAEKWERRKAELVAGKRWVELIY